MKPREERGEPLKQTKAGNSNLGNSLKQQIPAKKTHTFLRRSSLSKVPKPVTKPGLTRKSPSKKGANKENRGMLLLT